MYPPHFPVRLFPMFVSLFVFCKRVHLCHFLDSMCGSDGKESTCSAGDLGSIPGLRRSPRGGPGNPLQYSCLEIPHGQRSLAGHSSRGRKESDTTEHSHQAHTHNDNQWKQLD